MSNQDASLPAELLASLKVVRAKLQSRGDATAEVAMTLDILGRLDPGRVVRADRDIADAAGLHRQPPQRLFRQLLRQVPSHTERLLSTPGLEYLFLFHHDGRLREASLLKIAGGLPNPFLFAAIVWRLNDWVEPVRQAALACANRCFPLTDPGIVARCAAELLRRQASWSRWGCERSVLDEAYGRGDVADRLAELITRGVTGPQASLLRYALREPALDRHLELLAHEAMQPAVRAVALEALVNGKADWPSGTAWKWVDKSMGVRRRVTVFDSRIISVNQPRIDLISSGLKDRSAAVRNVALTGIIKHLLGTPEGRALAVPLLADKSPSVRDRAAFIHRH